MGLFLYAAGAAVVAGGLYALPKLLGFGSGGVKGDSYASSYQSRIGNVSKGSYFAQAQSWAAKGGNKKA